MDDPFESIDVPRPTPSRPLGRRLHEWLTWFGTGRLAVVAASVVAVGAGGYWLLRPPPTPVESTLPRAAPASVTTLSDSDTASSPSAGTIAPTSTTVGEVVVHVAGQVLAPGVYTLPPGSRVVDAVSAAGGTTAVGRLDAINLAQLLHDGDRLYVPRADDGAVVPTGVTPAEGQSAPTGSSAPAGPVDLNTATAEQLDVLPGVGPSTAAAIVAHREANGPFASIDGLDAVRGIGPAKLEALRELVTV